MKSNHDILKDVRGDKELLSIIETKRRKKAGKAVLYALPVCVVAIATAAANLGFVGGALAFALSLLACGAVLLLAYHTANRPFIVGKVVAVDVESSWAPARGTGIFGQFNNRMSEKHDLVVLIGESEDRDPSKTHLFVCPASYGNALRVGDTVLYHPYLKFPANLSHPTRCICMHCGTVQPASGTTCITCDLNLYNASTVE